jgi:hypothetical protein
MFAGRIEELNAIDKALLQTRADNPTHLMFLGERGIGKTSLLQFAELIANGQATWSDNEYRFLCVRLALDQNQSILDFAYSLGAALEHEVGKLSPELTQLRKAWGFLKTLDVKTPALGISVKDTKAQQGRAQIVDNLVYSMVNTIHGLVGDTVTTKFGLKEKRDGLVLLIDEADKASADLDLGTLLKRLVETLSAEQMNKLLVIATGLPQLKTALIASHESSLRLFEEHVLDRLSESEVQYAVNRGLDQANNVEPKITIDAEALNLIYGFSEGYPHFVQQIGYSAFEVDSDNQINKGDVEQAFFMSKGALERIGDRYYHKPYYQDIKTDAQRQVLNIMAEKWNAWVTRADIKKSFSGNPKTLDSCLLSLRKKGIILAQEGARGKYRLQWLSFAFWIKNHNRQTHRLT